MPFKLSALLLLILTQMFFACRNSEKHNEVDNAILNRQSADSFEQPLPSTVIPEQYWEGPMEQFFHSKGVLEYEQNDAPFQILNEDNTVFASLNLKDDQIKFADRKYSLSTFLQDSSLLARYQFFPRDFYYPDYSIIHFEYTSLKDGIADVYLNKEKNIRKRIRVKGDSAFRVDSWKDHFLGAMFTFKEKENLIRVRPEDNAKSVGYENYTGEFFIHAISEISGDWIKVECGEGICLYPCIEGKKYDGWLRWRMGDKLLIDIAYDC